MRARSFAERLAGKPAALARRCSWRYGDSEADPRVVDALLPDGGDDALATDDARVDLRFEAFAVARLVVDGGDDALAANDARVDLRFAALAGVRLEDSGDDALATDDARVGLRFAALALVRLVVDGGDDATDDARVDLRFAALAGVRLDDGGDMAPVSAFSTSDDVTATFCAAELAGCGPD
jgi:hypothetical protein